MQKTLNMPLKLLELINQFNKVSGYIHNQHTDIRGVSIH
jgi:hypothetical protein